MNVGGRWVRNAVLGFLLIPVMSLLAGPYRSEPGVLDTLKKSVKTLVDGGNVFALMENKDLAGLEKLLKRRPELARERNFHQMTPLHLAPDKDFAKLLLDFGAEIDAKTYPHYDYQHTPLHQAIYQGRSDVAKFLIDQGASISALALGEETPLHMAAQYGRVDIAEILVAKGAAVAAEGGTPKLSVPLWAAFHGQADVVKFFVDHGTAFDTVEAMFLNVTSSMGSRSNALNRYFLETCKVDPNSRRRNGSTLLHAAAEYFNPELFQVLIDHGADPKIPDGDGKTVRAYVEGDVSFALKHHPAEKAQILKILDRCEGR